MKLKNALFIIISILFLVACESESDISAIEQSFDDYRFAVLNGNGELAYSLVDQNTKEFYQKSFNQALNLSKYDTKNLSLLGRFYVVLARHRISPEEFKTMDGKQFFIHCVEQGWISDDSLLTQSVKVISVKDDFAQTHLLKNEQESPFGFSFKREGENWHVDLTSAFSITEKNFSEDAKIKEMTENQFIFATVGAVSGEKVTSKVWYPIKQNL